MTLIELNFYEGKEDLILHGQACATTRRTRHGKEGDVFVVRGQTYQITQVLCMTLEEVARLYYREEGYSSPDVFYAVWQMCYKGQQDTRLNQRVYLHKFRPYLTVHCMLC